MYELGDDLTPGMAAFEKEILAKKALSYIGVRVVGALTLNCTGVIE